MFVLSRKLQEARLFGAACRVDGAGPPWDCGAIDTSSADAFPVWCILCHHRVGFVPSGVDVGIAPIGQLTGSALAKSDRFSLVIGAGLLFDFDFRSEPDLHILAGQVDEATASGIPKLLSWPWFPWAFVSCFDHRSGPYRAQFIAEVDPVANVWRDISGPCSRACISGKYPSMHPAPRQER